MPAALRHFAINADDLARARRFHERAFGWTCAPWGSADFFQTRSAGESLVGALQARRTISGRAMPDIELTFGVDDLDSVLAAIVIAGGEVVMTPFRIQALGRLAFFQDTERNIGGVMQYEPGMTPAGARTPGAARLATFGINADDVARAKAFYEGVFGWRFSAWGPPDFYTCPDTGGGIGALLQARPLDAERVEPGLSVTFAVDDIHAAAAAVRAAGGEVLSAPYHIEGVGHHVFIASSEGAISALMQYEDNHR